MKTIQTVRYWKMENDKDRKDRVSNKFYSWIFMIAGLRFPPIYDILVFGFLHLKYIQKVGARNYGKERSKF